jgi:hypothetical protein
MRIISNAAAYINDLIGLFSVLRKIISKIFLSTTLSTYICANKKEGYENDKLFRTKK